MPLSTMCLFAYRTQKRAPPPPVSLSKLGEEEPFFYILVCFLIFFGSQRLPSKDCRRNSLANHVHVGVVQAEFRPEVTTHVDHQHCAILRVPNAEGVLACLVKLEHLHRAHPKLPRVGSPRHRDMLHRVSNYFSPHHKVVEVDHRCRCRLVA